MSDIFNYCGMISASFVIASCIGPTVSKSSDKIVHAIDEHTEAVQKQTHAMTDAVGQQTWAIQQQTKVLCEQHPTPTCKAN